MHTDMEWWTKVRLEVTREIENPKKYKNLQALRRDMKKRLGDIFIEPVGRGAMEAARINARNFKNIIEKEQYDGIVFSEGPSYDPLDSSKQAKTYIALRKDQISILKQP